MAEKVTIMKLKVDLQCEKCYKKVKKLLCKFPQIRDQAYSEKHNMVTITVLCCSPEKIRDKLCCKGCGCIKCIEIVEPKPDEPPPPPPPPPVRVCVQVRLCPPAARPPVLVPVPIPVPVPIGVCCVPCYEGRSGGPCFHGSGGPPPCFDGCYGRPVYRSYGGGRPCYLSSCNEYLYEENASGCTIM